MTHFDIVIRTLVVFIFTLSHWPISLFTHDQKDGDENIVQAEGLVTRP